MSELTSLQQWSTPGRGTATWTFTLTERDAIAWDRERLDMVEDAFWLLRRALMGHTEGPLTLPRLGFPIR
jgi:hypothetical protein